MKLTNISTIKELMQRHGFSFTKSLGQNFLTNPSVCPRMAAECLRSSQAAAKTIIEIGAGIGVLTRELAKVADKVIVIEIDESLKPILAETLADCDNVEIIWGDALVSCCEFAVLRGYAHNYADSRKLFGNGKHSKSVCAVRDCNGSRGSRAEVYRLRRLETIRYCQHCGAVLQYAENAVQSFAREFYARA
jgi:hypothetical protein